MDEDQQVTTEIENPPAENETNENENQPETEDQAETNQNEDEPVETENPPESNENENQQVEDDAETNQNNEQQEETENPSETTEREIQPAENSNQEQPNENNNQPDIPTNDNPADPIPPIQIQEPQTDNQSSLPRRRKLSMHPLTELENQFVPNTTRVFTPNVVSFQYKNTNPIQFKYTDKTTIKDAKHFLAPRFHVLPDCLTFKYNKVLENLILLKDIIIPYSKSISIEIDNKETVENGNSTEYLFMLQYEAYKLSFDENATVAQAKEKLTHFADSATSQIYLTFNGVRLNDSLKLSDLKYEQGDCIVAEAVLIRQDQFRTTKRLNTSQKRTRSTQKM